MRSTIRIGQRCGMSFWISAVDRTTPSRLSGSSARLAAGASVNKSSGIGSRSGCCRGRQERRAAHTVEQVRGELSVEEGCIFEQRAMKRHVGHDAVDNELIDCVAGARDGLVTVAA